LHVADQTDRFSNLAESINIAETSQAHSVREMQPKTTLARASVLEPKRHVYRVPVRGKPPSILLFIAASVISMSANTPEYLPISFFFRKDAPTCTHLRIGLL
jgi:hypothetical protein